MAIHKVQALVAFAIFGCKSDAMSYSSYRCLGQPWYYRYLTTKSKYSGYAPRLSQCAATCQLHNVCYDPLNDELLFYRSPDMASIPLLISGDGVEHGSFPADMFDFNYFNGVARRMRIRVLHEEPMGHDPSTAYILDFKSSGRKRVRKTTANLGHWLFDVGLPLYRLTQAFRTGVHAGVFTYQNPGNDTFFLDHPGWLSTIFKQKPLLQSSIQVTTCFQSFIIGDRCLESFDLRYNPKPSLHNFVSHVSHVTQIPYLPPGAPHITLIVKAGRRIPENYNDIIEAIARAFPDVPLSVLNMSRKDVWTVQKQVELCSRTTLLITPTGGVSAVFPYLSYGATLLQFGFWDDTRNASFDSESHRYIEFTHVTFKTFPVLLPEVTKKVSSSKSRTAASYGSYFYHNYIVNIPRLKKMVAEELYNWKLIQKYF